MAGWLGRAYVDRIFPLGCAGGGAMFVAWAAVFADVRRRWLFAGTLVLLSVPIYWFVDVIMRTTFAGGPMLFAGALMASDGDWDRASRLLEIRYYLALAMPLLWPLIPMSLALVAWMFGAKPRWRTVLVAAVLFVLAWPLAVFVRMPVENLGSHDLIHAVKSGFIIPFLFVALGIPLLSRREEKPPS